MKVLYIANSFGQDSTRYLYDVARADGKKWKVVNLYIGGCSLYRHYRNMLSGADAYEFELNGHAKSGIFVSLTGYNALLSKTVRIKNRSDFMNKKNMVKKTAALPNMQSKTFLMP